MPTIGLEGVRIRGPHGFYPEERELGNEFVIDLYVALPEKKTEKAVEEDDLYQTVNYETLFLLIQAEMRQPTQLIETLAYRLVERIEDHFPQLKGVRLRLRKLHPPLGGRVDAAVIELATGELA